MVDASFTAFGRRFSERVSDWRQELRDLENEGAIYTQWILDDEHGGPGVYRVRFNPREIYQYVRGVTGWDEYLEAGFTSVSDRDLAAQAIAASEDRRQRDPDYDGVCPADFISEEVESLVCGGRPERAERLRPEGSARDPLVMLHDIATGLPVAIRALTHRNTRPAFDITSERDLQDVVFLILRSVFHDARREEWTPSAAGNAKRIDINIPEARIAVEIKFVRDGRHARHVADELRVDIESYHSHPACGLLFAVVWDPNRYLADPHQIERDLTGARTKGPASFDVAVRVL